LSFSSYILARIICALVVIIAHNRLWFTLAISLTAELWGASISCGASNWSIHALGYSSNVLACIICAQIVVVTTDFSSIAATSIGITCLRLARISWARNWCVNTLGYTGIICARTRQAKVVRVTVKWLSYTFAI
jgi:hypothetical protein